MGKIKLEEIQQEANKQGWKLISDKYINLQNELVFECPKGHQVFNSWGRMRNKFICPTCQSSNIVTQETLILTKPKGTQRILALDQASHTTGYSIFDNGVLVKYGTFTTNLGDDIARFSAIKSWVLSMIQNLRPDYIGIEGIQFQEESNGHKIGDRMGVTVFQTLARLQGILMEVCYEQKIPYEICQPNIWRESCGVKGRTRTDRKRSMQNIVKQWHGVDVSDDEADAIGIGHYLSNFVTKNTKIENWEE